MPSTPEAPSSLVGTWLLVRCDIQFQDTREREAMYGAAARGSLIFTGSGRVMVYAEGCDRPLPVSDSDRAECHRHMVAYGGRYSAVDGCWKTEVDQSWNVRWVGTVQERSYWFERDELHVTSHWFASPLHGGRMARAYLIWKPEQ